MPFQGQLATGESLLSLQDSEAIRNFRAQIREVNDGHFSEPQILSVPRNSWQPRRVIAIDGSTITEALRNGFPIAEATLLKVSIVSIDLTELTAIPLSQIPSPRVFHEMEQTQTFDIVLPGANVVRKDLENDSPKRFFRESVFQAFNAKLDGNHETLLETIRAIEAGGHDVNRIQCPIEGCENKYSRGQEMYECSCPLKEQLYETDAFRFVERFNEVGSNGESHGEVRHVLEVISLINMLRFFVKPSGLEYLRENVFVLDGPLALFGHPAWLTTYVRKELKRINQYCKNEGGFDLAIFGFEKSGEFVNHFELIDFCNNQGARAKFPSSTVIAPDASYINKNITFRPDGSKPHGADTYFGRKVLYKTRSGDHAVVTTAMVNEASADFHRNDINCYPRLNDMLNVLDHLSTYLYKDGFMPLVRAHAHAAIPLGRGADIIRALFQDNGMCPLSRS